VSTVHANTPRDGLARIENMILMANLDLPSRAIREQIASAIELLVHVSRLSDGTRRITNITEVVGMEGEVVTTQDLFVFHKAGVSDGGKVLGHHLPTGVRPRCMERLQVAGIRLRDEVFSIPGEKKL
jgi:pilus assembly protein CpaF